VIPKRLSAAAFLALALFSSVALAADSLWSVGGPEGGSTSVLATDPQHPTTIYVATGNGGIWKTTDGAAHWKPAYSGLPTFGGHFLPINAIAVDPTVSSRAYAASNKGLFKTDDGGSSWTEIGPNVLQGKFLNAIAIDPSTSSTVFVGTSSGVYMTTDAGVNWKASNTGLQDGQGQVPAVFSLAIEPGASAGIVAGTNDGTFGSIDGGASWKKFGGTALDGLDVTKVQFGPALSTATQTAVDEASRAGFTSLDETVFAASPETGAYQLQPPYHPSNKFDWATSEWVFDEVEDDCDSPCVREIEALLLPPAPLDVPASVRLASSVGFEILVGTSGRGIYHSLDGGATFTAINDGLPSLGVSEIAGYPGSLTRYAAIDAGVAKTTDDAHWSAANKGLFASEVYAVAASKSSPSTVYAATDLSIFKSIDAGVSWQNLTSIGVDQQIFPALAVDPTNASIVYTATDEKGVLKTTNGGSSWSASNAGLPTTAIDCFAIVPSSPQTVYAGTDSGIFRSSDGGAHWAVVDSNTPTVRSLAIDPVDVQTMFAGTDNGIFRSTDGGAHWTDVSGSNSFLQTQIHGLAIDPAAHTHVYLATRNGVWKSTDGGTSWTEIDAGIPSTFGQPDSPGIVIEPGSKIDVAVVGTQVGPGNGVYRSTDGGATWTALDTGLTIGDVDALAVSSGSTPILYAGTVGGGVFRSPAAAPPPPPGKRRIIPAHPVAPREVKGRSGD
jgi:photosystem II stability/assembly factor-like uncharacterized protein